MPAKKVDKAADELYGLPLAEFTHGRDELAKRVRKEGRADEADAVRALRKPTAAAWALNQLARRRPKDIKRLLATGKRLREAHEALIGGGDRSALQKASAEERETIDELTRDATALASEAGRSPTAALAERIHNTLHAAALDEETAAELAAGRLVLDREAVGMGGTPAAAPKTTPKAPQTDKRRDLEREVANARAEELKAQRDHERSVKAAERAGKRADDAQRRADEARSGLREAEQQERDAAEAADRAARAAAAAQKKLG